MYGLRYITAEQKKLAKQLPVRTNQVRRLMDACGFDYEEVVTKFHAEFKTSHNTTYFQWYLAHRHEGMTRKLVSMAPFLLSDYMSWEQANKKPTKESN